MTVYILSRCARTPCSLINKNEPRRARHWPYKRSVALTIFFPTPAAISAPAFSTPSSCRSFFFVFLFLRVPLCLIPRVPVTEHRDSTACESWPARESEKYMYIRVEQLCRQSTCFKRVISMSMVHFTVAAVRRCAHSLFEWDRKLFWEFHLLKKHVRFREGERK